MKNINIGKYNTNREIIFSNERQKLRFVLFIYGMCDTRKKKIK